MKTLFSHFPERVFLYLGVSLGIAAACVFGYLNSIGIPGFDRDPKYLFLLSFFIAGISAPVYLFCSLVYWLMHRFHRPTNSVLNFLHAFGTVGSLLAAWLYFQYRVHLFFNQGAGEGGVADDGAAFVIDGGRTIWISMISAWAFGHALFLANIVFSLIKRQPPPPEEKVVPIFGRPDILDA